MAFVLGGLHTWAAATSHSMNADGINYLDIGDAYLRGDWAMAINPVWSPLYSWLLGLVMALFQPSMRWEFPLVHLVNFALYLGAMACFELFWQQLWCSQQDKRAKAAGLLSWPAWAWWALGYSLFLWSSLTQIELWAVTPDLLMAALVYLAAALLVRLRRGFTHWRTFAGLGALLGLGYLAKTIMFPLTFVFLGVGLLSAGKVRQLWPRTLLALALFLLFSLPFVWAISNAAGEWTFGQAGTITYVRYVNGVPYPHWQGEPPGNGTPRHPSRQIFEQPPIYEFGTPIGGTYPIAFNPVYWYAGVTTQVDLARQLTLLSVSLLFYVDLFFRQHGGLLMGVLTLYLLQQKRFHVRNLMAEIGPSWGLVIPALVALGLYALVLVEGRYIGVFVVLLWADLLANLRLPDTQHARKLIAGIGALMVLFLLVNLAAFNLQGLRDLTQNKSTPQGVNAAAGPPSWPGEVAETLQQLGIVPGDKVAVIGYAFDSFWARLARVKIVAELLDRQANVFWAGDPAFQDKVIAAFAGTGAKAIVAEYVPADTPVTGWHQVGSSNYYIYLIQ